MTQATIVQGHAEIEDGRRKIGGRVLVGSTGSDDTDAALAVGGRLAERDGGTLLAVAVVEPVPAYALGLAQIAIADVEHTRYAAMTRALRLQLERVGQGAQWQWGVRVGHAAEQILQAAAAEGATLIVLGLHHAGALDRVFGGETTLHVVRHSPVPVLAVPSLGTPLRRALVAVDFSETSNAAARLAASLLGDGASLTLAHVQPFAEAHVGDRTSWGEIYADGARRHLAELRDQLDDHRRVRTDTALLVGEPAKALAEFAVRGAYDVLAIGAHEQSALERLLVGSVTTHLVRGASCALLVAPAVPADA